MIDFIIVSLYLMAVLLIGLVSSKKIESLKEYAIADRSYSSFVMIASVSSAWIGGGTMIGLTEKVYSHGIVFLLIFLGDSICKILNATFVAPKIGRFYGMISSGDIMEQSYGKGSKIITGICGLLLAIGAISTQITAIGYFLGNFFHISKLLAILIGFGIIIIYATSGGIKSVTFTDVMQFLTLFIGIPVILLFAIYKIGGVKIFLDNIPADKIKLSHPGENLELLVSFLIFSFALTSPVFTQRLLMSKTPQQAIQAMKITALLDVPFYLMIALIGMVALELNSNIHSTTAFSYLIENALPIGIKGIAIATILAAMMSTTDSFLNSAAVSLVNDIIKPLSKNSISERRSLSLARITTISLGIISVIIAYYSNSVYDLLFYSRITWQPIIMVPFLAAILGCRVNVQSFYIGSIIALISIVIWEYYSFDKITKFHSILFGSVVNLVFFMSSNYYFNRIKNGKAG